MNNSCFCNALIALLSLLVSGITHAAPLTFTFEGSVVGTPTGIYIGEGASVVGTFTYDSALTRSSSPPSDPTVDIFDPIVNDPLSGFIWHMSVTVGSVTRSSSDNQLPNSSLHHVLEFNDAPDRDVFVYDLRHIANTDNWIRLILTDFATDDADGDPELISPGSGNLTGTPLTTPVDPSLADCSEISYNCLSGVRAFDDNETLIGEVQFAISSITAVPIPPTPVTIDIKPSKKPENVISLKKDKNLKVAIVGSETFDALQVDPDTVKFGLTGVEASPVRFKGQDYNRDGYSDLILTFKLSETGIECNDTSATLTGQTIPDTVINITGSDTFTVEPPCL